MAVIRRGIRSSALGGYGANKPYTIEPLSVRKVMCSQFPLILGGNFAHLAEAEDHDYPWLSGDCQRKV